VYKLTCPDCHKAYVGQTGRHFATRFKEHKAAFRNNCHISSFAKRLNEEAHSFGSMHSIMQLLHYRIKGAHLNTLERFHIHTEFAANNHLNNNLTILLNAIFDTLAKTNRHKPPQPLTTDTPILSYMGIHHRTKSRPHDSDHTDHAYLTIVSILSLNPPHMRHDVLTVL